MKPDPGRMETAPVFVVGNGRCGSTLLRLMLNAHPQLAIMGEIHYFDRIVRLKQHVADLSTRENRDRFFAMLPRVEGMDYLADLEAQLDAVRPQLEAHEEPSYELFYRMLMESYARSESASRFGDKSLEHVRHLDRLVELFPDAKIIHLVRDPRAVVESMLRMPWAPDDVVANSSKWRVNVWAAARFAQSSDRMLETRYEDLVTAPERELRRICEFLKEDYDPRMLQYHKTAGTYIRNEPWKQGTTSPVTRSTVEQWRERVPPRRIALIESIAGRLMTRYGYERARLGFATRMATPFLAVAEIARYAFYKRRMSSDRRDRNKDEIRLDDSPTALLKLLIRSWSYTGTNRETP